MRYHEWYLGEIRLKNSITALLLAGLAIPAFILLFPVYRITIFLGLLNSYASLIIPYIATSVSFNTLLFTGFLEDFREKWKKRYH